MDYEERLKEISATAHMISIAIEYEDNKELVQNSVINLVRDIDQVVEAIDHDPTFSGRMS